MEPCGKIIDLIMPFLIGLSVLYFVTVSLFQYFDVSISSDILSNILTFSPIVSLVYIVAGWFLGSAVRIASGVSLVSLGTLDLGIPVSIGSWLQIAIVLIGALTPI
jgi:hypothetical protein